MKWRVQEKLRTGPFGPGVWRLAQLGMKLFDQAGFAYSRLADDQHELPITLTCPLPAPHQQGDFLVPPHEGREMALASAASAPAPPHQSEQGYRLRHAF